MPCLPALSVRCHDHRPGNAVRSLRAVVLAEQMKAKVDARRNAEAGADTAVVDVQHPSIDADETSIPTGGINWEALIADPCAGYGSTIKAFLAANTPDSH